MSFSKAAEVAERKGWAVRFLINFYPKAGRTLPLSSHEHPGKAGLGRVMITLLEKYYNRRGFMYVQFFQGLGDCYFSVRLLNSVVESD